MAPQQTAVAVAPRRRRRAAPRVPIVRRRSAPRSVRPRRKSKQRVSITGLLAFVLTPLGTFLYGVPGYIAGAGNLSGAVTMTDRLKYGITALGLAYTGFNFQIMKWQPRALLQGWIPIAGHYAVRKLHVNRLASKSVPLLL